MVRVAFLSGGKDSFYAAMLERPIDYALLLVYEFPRPSPHIVNLGKAVETLLNAGYKVLVVRLPRGHEKDYTVNVLRMLGADTIVAGDVYIEDHLRYMEGIASQIGAKLREPLWGRDPEEILREEVGAGIVALIMGSNSKLKTWVGRTITEANIEEFIAYTRKVGMDPLGEKGEYHTIVVKSPLHNRELSYKALSIEAHGDYYILRLY